MDITINTSRVRLLKWKYELGTPLTVAVGGRSVGFTFTRAGALKAAALAANALLALAKTVEANYVIEDLQGHG